MRLLTFLTVYCLAAICAGQTTLLVPDEYTTIQEAVDALPSQCDDGEQYTIEVGPGIYNGWTNWEHIGNGCRCFKIGFVVAGTPGATFIIGPGYREIYNIQQTSCVYNELGKFHDEEWYLPYIVRDLVFVSNDARNDDFPAPDYLFGGGAFYLSSNYGNTGEPNIRGLDIIFEDCLFTNNAADVGGHVFAKGSLENRPGVMFLDCGFQQLQVAEEDIYVKNVELWVVDEVCIPTISVADTEAEGYHPSVVACGPLFDPTMTSDLQDRRKAR